MVHMEQFTTEELMKDRIESLQDVVVCDRAIEMGVFVYDNDNSSVVDRRLDNLAIIALIEQELDRREVLY